MDVERPAVSRETRALLAIAVASIASLWLLARIRFPDRPVTPNPMPPVLAQLTPPSPFQDLAGSVAGALRRIEPVLAPAARTGGRGGRSAAVTALRLRADMAAALIDEPQSGDWAVGGVAAELIGHDPVTRLAVFRLADTGDPVRLDVWSPRRLEAPRFLIGAVAGREGAVAIPLFVPMLFTGASPAWTEPVWRLARDAPVPPDRFVFTTDGLFAGLSAADDGGSLIVPAGVVAAEADRIAARGLRPPGWLGITAQATAGDLAAALGGSGVAAAWVDPRGPAHGLVAVADVIEQVGGRAVQTLAGWDAQVRRVAAGETVVLTVRGREGRREVTLIATPPTDDAIDRPGAPVLGLNLRLVRGVGSEVIAVAADSAAARAGIAAGDTITFAGGSDAPTPAQVARLFAALAPGERLVVAIARGGARRLVVVGTGP